MKYPSIRQFNPFRFWIPVLLSFILALPLQSQEAKSVQIADFSTVTHFHFTPQIAEDLKQAFKDFEETETRNFEFKHGDSGPLKYEAYRLNPPAVQTLASANELDEAAKTLGFVNPSPEQRRKILIAHALAKVLPAQMRAGDKHPKIKPARVRYAADYIYDSLRKAGDLKDFAARARSAWANEYIYRKAQMALGYDSQRILTTEEICLELERSPHHEMTIDWAFSDGNIEPYFYLKNSNPTLLRLENYSCDPNESPEKARDKIYKALHKSLKARIGNTEPVFFESLYFLGKRLNGYSIDFNEIPHDLFQKWHNEDLSGWTVVEIPAPTKPFADERDVQEHIFDTLNPIYLEDKFKWSIIRFAEASSIEGRRKMRDAEDVDFREVKAYYEREIQNGVFEKRIFQISLMSAVISYSKAELDDQLESVFSEELKRTRDELAPKATELMKRPFSPDRKTLEIRERNSQLSDLKREAFSLLVQRIADRLSIPKESLTIEGIRGISGNWDEIIEQVKGRSWEGPLNNLKDRFKETNRPQLFPIVDPVLSVDSETQARSFRMGMILSFYLPDLYDLQLDLKKMLERKAEEDLFQWSYEQFFDSAFSFSVNGTTEWHHCIQDFGRRPNELTPSDSHQEILKMAARLHHQELKKPRRGVERAYLADDFIPRIKKDDTGGFFGLFP